MKLDFLDRKIKKKHGNTVFSNLFAVHYHPGLLSELTPKKPSPLNIFLPFEFKT